MKRRKLLVLATLAVFCLSMGGLGLFRGIFAPHSIVFIAKGYPSIGAENARIELVAFEDFLCRSCGFFSLEIFPAIQSTYIEPGISKYVMVPVALSQHSKDAANAALSVFYRTPEYFFPFVHDLFLFCSHRKPAQKDFLDLAGKIPGLDLAAFAADIKIGRYDTELEKNLKQAKNAMKKNVRMPAVFLNGVLMPGASFDTLSLQIDDILKEDKP